jgi:hypothetical protein
MPTVDGVSLDFQEAISYFRNKVNAPTERWDDLLGAEHDHAFMVAGATSAELLADLRGAVDQAIASGITRTDFARQFDQIVAQRGWSYRGGRDWRANLIYAQNLRTAYQAGRYAQMRDPDVLKTRPFWQYIHGGSRLPRLSHLAHDRKVYRADDPWWDVWYPPNGYNCSCRVLSLSQRDLDRLGLTVDTPPEGETFAVQDERGQVRRVSNLPDQGFDYAPGQSVLQGKREIILNNILKRLPPNLRQQVEVQAANIPPAPVQPQVDAGPPTESAPPPTLDTWEDYVGYGRGLYGESIEAIDAALQEDIGDLQKMQDRLTSIQGKILAAQAKQNFGVIPRLFDQRDEVEGLISRYREAKPKATLAMQKLRQQ